MLNDFKISKEEEIRN